MNSIHIEFSGLPGAGKTAIARQLTDKPKQLIRNKAYETALQRLLFPQWAWTFASYMPGLAARGIARVTQQDPHNQLVLNNELTNYQSIAQKLLTTYTHDEKRREHVTATVQYLITEYAVIQEHLSDDATVLYDEGFLQRAVSIFCPPSPATALTGEQVASYVAAMPDPDVVVIIDVTPETAEARMRNRKERYPDSYRKFSSTKMMTHLKRTERLLDLLEEHISSAPMIRIENEGNLEETVRVVKKRLIQETDIDL